LNIGILSFSGPRLRRIPATASDGMKMRRHSSARKTNPSQTDALGSFCASGTRSYRRFFRV